jgi:hypothetical protein
MEILTEPATIILAATAALINLFAGKRVFGRLSPYLRGIFLLYFIALALKNVSA